MAGTGARRRGRRPLRRVVEEQLLVRDTGLAVVPAFDTMFLMH